jgi:hypothetical protein
MTCGFGPVNSFEFNKMFYLSKIRVGQSSAEWRKKHNEWSTVVGSSGIKYLCNNDYESLFKHMLRVGKIPRHFSCFGHFFESIAVHISSIVTDINFMDGFTMNGSNKTACTVDGFGANELNELVILEVKCPITRKIKQTKKIHFRYTEQVAMQAEICNAKTAIYSEVGFKICSIKTLFSADRPLNLPAHCLQPRPITTHVPLFFGYIWWDSKTVVDEIDASELEYNKICDLMELDESPNYKLVYGDEQLHLRQLFKQNQNILTKHAIVLPFCVYDLNIVYTNECELPKNIMLNKTPLLLVNKIMRELCNTYTPSCITKYDELVIYLSDVLKKNIIKHNYFGPSSPSKLTKLLKNDEMKKFM